RFVVKPMNKTGRLTLLSVAILVVACVTLSGPSAARADLKFPPGTVVLPGKVEYPPQCIKPITPKTKVPTVNFTAAELKQHAPERISKMQGKDYITTKKGKKVLLSSFVDQLNSYETYLNSFGQTLRHPNAQKGIKYNMGKILKYVPFKPH